MKKNIKNMLSGELFFTLFLFSGVFKESLGFPIDISIVFLGLSIISIICKLGIRKYISKAILLPILILVIIYMVLLISYTGSPGQVYATDKIIRFTVTTIPAIVLSLFLFDNKQAILRFFLYIASLSVILSLISIPSIIHRGSSLGFIGFNGGNYQGLALLNGVALIIQLFYFLIEAKSKRWKTISLIAAFITAFVLFASGSRMPILAFIVATIFVLFNSVYLTKGKIWIRKGVKILLLLPVLVVFTLPFILKSGFFETIIYRFLVLFTEEGGGDSSSGRIDRYLSAYEMMKDSPLIGTGLGSFPLYFLEEDIVDYPHNLIVEVFAEIGVIGLIICFLVFLIGFIRVLKLYKKNTWFISTYAVVAIAIFIYYLVFSMVSGDLNSNRNLYVFLAMICMFPANGENEQRKDF